MIIKYFDTDLLDKGDFPPSFHGRLGVIKSDVDQIKAKMEREYSKWIGDLGLQSVKLDSESNSGYYFRVAKETENIVNDMENYDVVKGGAIFLKKFVVTSPTELVV